MILVAGGTGRLGTKVVALLRERGMDVRVLARDHRNLVFPISGQPGRLSIFAGPVRADAVAQVCGETPLESATDRQYVRELDPRAKNCGQ